MKAISVLITHISYQAAGSFIKMLRDSKMYNVYIVGCDSIPKGYSSGSMLVDKFYHIPKGLDNDLYIEFVKRICDENKVDVILSAEEQDLILFKRAKLSQSAYDYISDEYIFNLFKDKHFATIEMMKEDVIVPKTIYDMFEFNNSSCNRFIQRERISCCSRGIKIFDRNDVDSNYIFYNDKYITQEFVDGKMYTVDVICDKKGNPKAIIPRQSLSIKDGTTFKCIIENEKEIIGVCKKVYSKYLIPGISNIQFIVKNGIPYFIELNPRAAATIIAASLVSINFLDMYISHFFFNEKIPNLEDWMGQVHWNSVVSRYYQETVYLG